MNNKELNEFKKYFCAPFLSGMGMGFLIIGCVCCFIQQYQGCLSCSSLSFISFFCSKWFSEIKNE